MPFSLPSSFSITRFNFFCLQVLLTRASLLALAKSIYYYSNLYDGRNSADTQTISSFINDLTDVPFLAEEKRNVCEGKLRYDECYNEQT